MLIVDKAGKQVQGSASFDYLDYSISASTIGGFPEVLVFQNAKSTEALHHCRDTAAAIRWVENQHMEKIVKRNPTFGDKV